MARGKYEAVKAVKPVKTVSALLAVVLVLVCAIGGTVAWLITQTDPVTNTFTYGDINIDLDESGMTPDPEDDGYVNEYEMIPGSDIVKDPTITVKAGSEDCYLFVKLEKSENFDTFMTYEMAEGWTALDDGDGDPNTMVYYREVSATDVDVEYGVILEDKVHVKEEVTKEQLNELDAEGAENYPTLTVTAYAVQKDNIATAGEAWALASAENTDSTETTAPAETQAS